MDKVLNCKCGGKARYREKGAYCWIECRKCGNKTGYYPVKGTENDAVLKEWEKKTSDK